MPSASHPLQHFSRKIMPDSDALGEHDGKDSIGDRNSTNLQFADNTDTIPKEQQELKVCAESLNKTCTKYKIYISAEKTKLVTYSTNSIQREIKAKEHKLEIIISFKYQDITVTNDGKQKVLSRNAGASTAAPGLPSFKNGLECDYPRSTTERSEGPTERSERVC